MLLMVIAKGLHRSVGWSNHSCALLKINKTHLLTNQHQLPSLFAILYL